MKSTTRLVSYFSSLLFICCHETKRDQSQNYKSIKWLQLKTFKSQSWQMYTNKNLLGLSWVNAEVMKNNTP